MRCPASLLALLISPALCDLASAQEALQRAEAQLRGPPTAAHALAAIDEPGYLGLKADDQGPGGGIRVIEVKPGGPAATAGLEPDDLIRAVQGEAVRTMDEFAERMARMPAGARVSFRVRRGDENRTIDVVLGRRKSATDASTPQQRLTPPVANTRSRTAPLGVRVQSVSEDVRRAADLPSAGGAHVTNVTRNSAADKAGIPVDAVIISIDDQKIGSPDDAARVIGQARVGQPLAFKLYEHGQEVERRVTPEAARDSGPSTEPVAGTVNEPPRATASELAARTEETIEAAHSRIQALEQRMAELERQLAALQHDLEKARSDVKRVDDGPGKASKPQLRVVPSSP